MFNTSTSVENDTASYHNNALERGTLWLIGVANGGATSDQLRKQLTFLVAVSLVALVGIVIDAGLHSSFTTPWNWSG